MARKGCRSSTHARALGTRAYKWRSLSAAREPDVDARGSLSGKALVSADARVRPVGTRAAFEAQIPTEVPRQDPSRSPLHHEGGARKASLPFTRWQVHWPSNGRRSRPHSSSSATALEDPFGRRKRDSLGTHSCDQRNTPRWQVRRCTYTCARRGLINAQP